MRTVGAADRTCQLASKPLLQLGQLDLEVLLADLASVSAVWIPHTRQPVSSTTTSRPQRTLETSAP